MNGQQIENETLLEIPELPEGRILTFILKSNWGDLECIGLNGVEIFDSQGQPVSILTSDVFDCDGENLQNVRLDENSPTKRLFDGCYKTTDETHLWCKKIRDAKNFCVLITATLTNRTKLAMIRIWIILLTTDEEILERIVANDQNFDENDQVFDDVDTETLHNSLRPSTGSQASKSVSRSNESTSTLQSSQSAISCQSITVEILDNWGLQGCLGLTGVELLLADGNIAFLTPFSISASGTSSSKNLDRLLNGKNVTTNERDMWLTNWDKKSSVILNVSLPKSSDLIGLRIWNYNDSIQMSFAGAKVVNIFADRKLLAKNLVLRKAPGNTLFPYGQEILFADLLKPNNDRITKNGGFIYQIQILSTWGDEFYVGLNGIQFFDETDREIKLQKKNLVAYPDSINILPHVQNDQRIGQNLIYSQSTKSEDYCWLSPLLNDKVIPINKVYVIFDEPTLVKRISIWNYAKTPTRGVKNFRCWGDYEERRTYSCAIKFSHFPISSNDNTFHVITLRPYNCKLRKINKSIHSVLGRPVCLELIYEIVYESIHLIVGNVMFMPAHLYYQSNFWKMTATCRRTIR